jgi:hypothetical protein
MMGKDGGTEAQNSELVIVFSVMFQHPISTCLPSLGVLQSRSNHALAVDVHVHFVQAHACTQYVEKSVQNLAVLYDSRQQETSIQKLPLIAVFDLDSRGCTQMLKVFLTDDR